jgi:aminomethyltransferase
LIGLEVAGPRVPREGCGVWSGDALVGEVRSGTKSPTLGKNIATAMVLADVAASDAVLTVDIRGNRVPATRTSIPFYRRPDRS